MAGTDPVSCATPLTGLGTGATTAALQDLRFYISNVRLTRRNSTSVPLTLGRNNAYNLTRGGNRVSLIDLENGTGSCTEGDDEDQRDDHGHGARGRVRRRSRCTWACPSS